MMRIFNFIQQHMEDADDGGVFEEEYSNCDMNN